MPKGYWIAKANIIDNEKLARYGKQAEIAIEKYGGRFLVRGGRHETKEGADYSRNVVVEFDSCLLYTSPSPRDGLLSRMPSSA